MDRKKIGVRIQATRVLTGLDREEFAKKQNVSTSAIKNWELGLMVPKHDKIVGLLNAFKKCGIFVSHEWILNGEGAGPSFLEKQ